MAGIAPIQLLKPLVAIGLLAGAAIAPTVAADEIELQPKIVVQVGHQAPVQAAVWANRDRNLISLAQDGSIVVWDLASSNIVNSAQLPVNWNDLGLSECVKLRSMELDEQTGLLTIAFALELEDAHVSARNGADTGAPLLLVTMKEQLCRGIAEAASWYSYTYDLGSMALKSGGPDEIPGGIERRSFSVLAARNTDGSDILHEFTYARPPDEPPVLMPPSGGSGLRLERNYDDGKRGNFDRRDENLQFNESTCASLSKCRYGVNVLSADGQLVAALTGNPRSYFLDADLSGDGRQLVRVEGLRNDTQARVEVLELAGGGRSWDAFSVERAYHQVQWLGEERYALFSHGYKVTDDTDDAMEGFPPVLIVGSDCARDGGCPRVPSYSSMEPVDDKGGFLGLFDLKDCYRDTAGYFATRSFCPGGREMPPSDNVDTRIVLPPELSTQISAVSAPSSAAPPNWGTLASPAFAAEEEITAIKLSPDRRKLAIAVRKNPPIDDDVTNLFNDEPAVQIDRVYVYDFSASGQPGRGRAVITFSEELDRGYFGLRGEGLIDSSHDNTFYLFGLKANGSILQFDFSTDGRRLIFSKAPYQAPRDSRLYVVDTNSGVETKVSLFREYSPQDVSDVIRVALTTSGAALADFPAFAARNVAAAGRDRAFGLENRQLVDIATGRIIASDMSDGVIVRAGYIETSDILWGASEEGAIHFWDARDGRNLLKLFLFPGNRFFAVMPDGRYDTNLGSDSNLIRWVVPDAPWQSLAAQTFMRDFYEPGLYRKLLDCRVARDCGRVFAPLPSFASINRVLPKVEIIAVAPGNDPGEALVSMKVTEGIDRAAANGKTRSGIHNPRLFIDNKLVAYANDTSTAPAKKRRGRRNRGEAEANEQLFEFRVPVATVAGSERMTFSAYAFNEDRIKSETASYAYQRPPAAPRKRRAFLINIGIDRYDSSQFRSLNFAGNDAALLARRLAEIPGYEMRQVTIGTARDADGKLQPVNRSAILNALGLLAFDENRAKRLRELASDGIDASQIEVATPDDIVIISYSGHGWADQRGDFYLIPTNVGWNFDQNIPQFDTVVSTEDLTGILDLVQAGEISLIIDACHSAASVDSGAFKPGPMGDSGLGQLAYDKGIRILAAAQADDLALEDSRLEQGLLTYALAAEGLTENGGASDRDEDGRILLSEWFAYAVDRLPKLSEDVERGNFRGIRFSNADRESRQRKVQQPSLFDFNAAPSSIVLRTGLTGSNRPD